jgi:hypothetical protein
MLASEPRESLLEHGNLLLLREASREHHQARPRRQLELGAQIAAAPRG